MSKRKRINFEVEKFDTNPKEKKRRKYEVKVKEIKGVMDSIRKSNELDGLVESLVKLTKDKDLKEDFKGSKFLTKVDSFFKQMKEFKRTIGTNHNFIGKRKTCFKSGCDEIVSKCNKFNSPCNCKELVCMGCGIGNCIKNGGYVCFVCNKRCILPTAF